MLDRLTEEDPPSIGGFELCARLGEGGLGRVYLGLSPGGQPVAVKVLWEKYAGDREFLRAFGMDLGAARQVNGMYTAPVVAAGLDDRPPWLATTFVPGPSLGQLRAARLPAVWLPAVRPARWLPAEGTEGWPASGYGVPRQQPPRRRARRLRPRKLTTVLLVCSAVVLIGVIASALGMGHGNPPKSPAAAASSGHAVKGSSRAGSLPPMTVYALGNEITPIDAATLAVGRTLPIASGSGLGWQPESSLVAVAETAQGLTAYIPAYRKEGYVVPVDVATDTAGTPISLGEPSTVTPINVATGTTGTPIHAPQDTNAFTIVFTPDGSTAYVAGPEITAIHVATGAVAATIPVSASDLAIAPDGKTLYALGGTMGSGSVTPINTASNTAGTPIPVSSDGEILVAPNGKTVYVVDEAGGLTPIDVATGTSGARVTAPGGYANDMAITPDGKTIWICDSEDSKMIPYDTATTAMGTPIKISGNPTQVAIVP